MKLTDLFVYDRDSKRVHKVGSDSHDSLYVDSNGVVVYYNLQNGCGTLPDGTGTYVFIETMDGCMCNSCRHNDDGLCAMRNCDGEIGFEISEKFIACMCNRK